MTCQMLQQPRVDLGIAAPDALVAPHDAGDGSLLALTQRQQLIAAAKRQGQRREIGHDALFASSATRRRLIADDEAAAHRVVSPVRDLRAGVIESHEAHAVGMQRQRVLVIEGEVGALVERDGLFAQQ